MSIMAIVEEALSLWPKPMALERGIRVPTHCLYPSNSAVPAVISQRGEFFRVDDDGAALDEIAQAIHTEQALQSSMRGLVRRSGCTLTRSGAIMSPAVRQSELVAAIVLVANTSQEVAEHLLSVARPPRKDFRKAIEEILNQKFKDRWSRNERIAGASNKMHGFDYVVRISEGRQLALDFVVPDASSVNSAVVAHLDVKLKNVPNLEQRIVYDDSQSWNASDIELLKAGARPIPFSAFLQSLERFAA